MPGYNKDGSFLQSTTIHLLSRTVILELYNPFSNEDIIITYINAEAYSDNQHLGVIQYGEALILKPGSNLTPKLPISINLDGVGGRMLRGALGGAVQVDVTANCTCSISRLEGFEISYRATGIPAHVRV